MGRTFPTEHDMARSPKTPLAVIVEDYLVAISARLEPATVNGYRKSLMELDALMGHPALEEFTLDNVARVIARKRKKSASAARLMAATARAFSSKYLLAERIWHDNGHSILANLGVPKFNGRREPFTDTEFETIRKALNAFPNSTRYRDRAVTLLAMGCGLRAKEIRELDIANVHIERPLSDSWLQVEWQTSKGKHSRKVRIDPIVAAAIHAYIVNERVEKDGTLFLARGDKPFREWGFQRYTGRISDALERYGIHGWGAHRSRHQWATDNARLGLTESELALEGGWAEGSPVPRHYVHTARFNFADLQRKPTAMSGLRRSA